MEKKKKPKFKPGLSKSRAPDSPAPKSGKRKKDNDSKEEEEEEPEVVLAKKVKVNVVAVRHLKLEFFGFKCATTNLGEHLKRSQPASVRPQSTHCCRLESIVLESKTDHLGVRK